MSRLLIFMAVIAASMSLHAQEHTGLTPPLPEAEMILIEEAEPLPVSRAHSVIGAASMRQAVFDNYDLVDSISINFPATFNPGYTSDAFQWLDDATFNALQVRQLRQRYMIAHPDLVRFNERLLPEPPRKFHAVLDPTTAKLVFEEDAVLTVAQAVTPNLQLNIDKRHWIHNFDARLQFSQAYLSPNWYQGGSNNLTMLLHTSYGVKINKKFHPKVLAEANISYNLAVHGTPEDSLRNYNISEDLFQFTGKAGYYAFNKWWYSVTGTFKTQFFKNYEVNSPTLRAAFLSPAELNMGVGMTYSHANAAKTFTFDASISPFSWNFKTCIHPDMNVTDYGIEPGRTTAHEFGSSAEAKLAWKPASNITIASRLFVFTDYTYLQCDWENTFSFDINRFLSTQLYVHVRYDSSTPRIPDSRWHVWQIKEILSFGFSYKFATI